MGKHSSITPFMLVNKGTTDRGFYQKSGHPKDIEANGLGAEGGAHPYGLGDKVLQDYDQDGFYCGVSPHALRDPYLPDPELQNILDEYGL